jgi:hypothetical protein
MISGAFVTSFLADPKGWAAAAAILIGTPVGAIGRWIWKLQKRVELCEQDRAVLRAELGITNRDLAVERGRVNVLTDLFKKEANIG